MKFWTSAFVLIAFALIGVQSTEDSNNQDGILVLTADNFNKAVEDNPYILVEFYSPSCGRCKTFAPEYTEVAKQLKSSDSNITLAQVNASHERKLAEEHGIQKYPSLVFYRFGVPIDYKGDAKSSEILVWLSSKTNSTVKELDSVEAAENFVNENQMSIVGFFRNTNSPDAQDFLISAIALDMFSFGVSANDEIFTHYGAKDGSVFLFKAFDEKMSEYKGGAFSVASLKRFIEIESMPLIIDYNENTFSKIFGGLVKSVLLLFVNQGSDHIQNYVEPLRDLAKEYRNEILFVTVSAEPKDYSRIYEYFGLSQEEVPSMRLVEVNDMTKYKPSTDSFAPKKVKEFLKKYTEGKLKPHLLSQKLPEDWNEKPVKILVGTNFNEIALDKGKSVLVEFHAPWCVHCKEFASVYEQLAEKYKNDKKVVIAKIDATTNEFQDFKISSFPTIRLFRKGDNKVFDFNGERSVDGLTSFIESGGESVDPNLFRDKQVDDAKVQEQANDQKQEQPEVKPIENDQQFEDKKADVEQEQQYNEKYSNAKELNQFDSLEKEIDQKSDQFPEANAEKDAYQINKDEL